MARTKAGAKPDDKTTEMGVAHDHGDGAKNHLHRLGDLPHLHADDGKAVLLDEQGRPLFADEGHQANAPTEPFAGLPPDSSWGSTPDGYQPVPVPKSPRVVTTTQARESLADEPPPGPLQNEARDQARALAREQGIARRGPSATDTDDLAMGDVHPDVLRAELATSNRRPIDAAQVREEVIRGALSTTLRPQADVSAHIHSSEATLLIEMAGLVGEMWATNGNGELLDVGDIRKANRLIRKMAAARGVDLSEPASGNGGGS
jgi:hypothetical protein